MSSMPVAMASTALVATLVCVVEVGASNTKWTKLDEEALARLSPIEEVGRDALKSRCGGMTPGEERGRFPVAAMCRSTQQDLDLLPRLWRDSVRELRSGISGRKGQAWQPLLYSTASSYYRGGTSEVSIFLVKNPSLTTESANQNPFRAELFLLPSRPLPVEMMAR